MVAEVVDSVTIDRVLDVEPDFLVKHQHGDVVEEWCHVCRAETIVASSNNQDRVVAWQVAHGMAETGDWRLALDLERNEFTMYNLTVDDYGLEVAQFVLQLALLVLAAKEVDSFLHGVALNSTKIVVKSE